MIKAQNKAPFTSIPKLSRHMTVVHETKHNLQCCWLHNDCILMSFSGIQKLNTVASKGGARYKNKSLSPFYSTIMWDMFAVTLTILSVVITFAGLQSEGQV